MEILLKPNDGGNRKLDEINSVESVPETNLIYGIMISDRNGKTLITIEKNPGILQKIICFERQDRFDLELISMFINAMQKFCNEINVRNITGFGVKGNNLILSSLTEKIEETELTMTIFSHPSINIELLKPDFLALFHEFIDRYDPFISKFEVTGVVSYFSDFDERGRDFIETLEKQHINRKPIIKFNTEKAKRFSNYLSQMERKGLRSDDFLKLKVIQAELLDCVLNENSVQLNLLENEILNFIEKAV